MQSSIISHLAQRFEPYLTLHRLHPSKVYSYAAREFFNLPVIDYSRHAPKCKAGESWVYIATPAEANLSALPPEQRLYVGAQTQDRMFRGDGLSGDNFHHAEMRRGRGDDNLGSYLQQTGEVKIHRIDAASILHGANSIPELQKLTRLMRMPLPARAHQAWWLEQYVLHHELRTWRWNKDGAAAHVSKSLAEGVHAEPPQNESQPDQLGSFE
ncbi:MAG: hypothetical protein KBC73_22015 [Burkholderiaceae bacterium]|nr:hypothetical protein [Burkholderiaceae bacterium]